MHRAIIRSAVVGTRVATVATIAAALVGLAGGPVWAAEAELSDEQLAALCPEVDHLTADDLPEGVELPELRAACERWSAETPDDAGAVAADEPVPAGSGSTAASEPVPTNPSPTAQLEPTAQPDPTARPETGTPTTYSQNTPVSSAAAAPTTPPPDMPRQSADLSHPAGAASSPRSATIEMTSPPPPAMVEPPPPTTVVPGSPPAELFRADLPPAALPQLPLAAASEFGLFGYQPERRPTDLEAAGFATALPTESPQLPLPIVLATILLAAVGTALARSAAFSASRDE